ncbi:Secreted RxLR effector peptide protein [Phytophthora palmivora]|uniref:Secreted RxLR effector peptide protein n=1 Tax=Phytophthora palmivora TaxID=4796 RepID=A0A2P4X0V2_9STRA|nr:Secreted RxLR effector peptide protein [Phytophthora palmivora]
MVKLHSSEDVIELARSDEAHFNEKRMLREEAKSPNQDDEERLALSDLFKKFGTSFKNWSANRQFKGDLKKLVRQTTNYENSAQKLMKDGVTPDVFYKTFKLGKTSNKYKSLNTWSDNYYAPTHEYELWQSLKMAWERVHPAKTWQFNA